jgi:hypothetical protein
MKWRRARETFDDSVTVTSALYASPRSMLLGIGAASTPSADQRKGNRIIIRGKDKYTIQIFTGGNILSFLFAFTSILDIVTRIVRIMAIRRGH